MEVRTFKGKDIQDVMQRIRSEYGGEALILSAEHVDGGVQVQARAGRMTIEQNDSQRLIANELRPLLKSHGVSGETAQAIFRAAVGRGEDGEQYLSRRVDELLTFDCSFLQRTRSVAFMGASGVGKTTSVAKLASRMREAFEISVAVISADFERPQAALHLEVYAQQLGIHCVAVDKIRKNSARTIAEALHTLSDASLVLIDTGGYGPKTTHKLPTLTQQLDQAGVRERILVLPATGNQSYLESSLENFSHAAVSRLAFSKLDESLMLGPVLNTALKSKLPVSLFTTGPEVPADIEPATARRLSWLLRRSIH